jgi:hypothetical protein
MITIQMLFRRPEFYYWSMVVHRREGGEGKGKETQKQTTRGGL